MPLMIPAPFNTGNYDVIYKIAHLLATSYVGLTSASIDVFYMALIAVCRAQLNILQERLMNVTEDAQAICMNNPESYEAIIENILKECIILHEAINR
ncbi:hypothetical protein QE152_g23152 [Popillia japonica]|uniref:Uncharacterized protein n=1 Tax=Popillia japonica TaxID=7064 RepID=A0AAW1KJF0_POPJA